MNVTIKPLEPDRFAEMAAWLSDPAIHRWLTAEWRGRTVTPSVIAMALRNRRNLLYQFETEGVIRGLVAFSEFEPRDRSAMVWYLLGDQRLAGKGVTTEAVRLLCATGFGELQLASIWAMVLAPNSASMRLLQKLGFCPAGVLRQVERVEDVQVDRHYFDLLPSDLRRGPGGALA